MTTPQQDAAIAVMMLGCLAATIDKTARDADQALALIGGENATRAIVHEFRAQADDAGRELRDEANRILLA